MNLNTLFHQCLYFCIVLIIFTLALNFISVLWFETGAVPIETHLGKAPGATAEETVGDWINNQLWFFGDFGALFVLVSVGSAIPVIGLTILSGQTTPLAIYIFGMVFWTSFIRALAILTFIPVGISIIFVVAVIFIFIGAVAAILGYSG